MATKETITWEIEHTDTFGGEANYCWVKRHTLVLPVGASNLALIRAAKKAVGWSGVRCKVDDLGDEFHIRPRGMSQIAFVTFREA